MNWGREEAENFGEDMNWGRQEAENFGEDMNSSSSFKKEDYRVQINIACTYTMSTEYSAFCFSLGGSLEIFVLRHKRRGGPFVKIIVIAVMIKNDLKAYFWYGFLLSIVAPIFEATFSLSCTLQAFIEYGG
jgi:hypothetical protein